MRVCLETINLSQIHYFTNDFITIIQNNYLHPKFPVTMETLAAKGRRIQEGYYLRVVPAIKYYSLSLIMT